MLDVKDLHAYYGMSHIIQGIFFAIPDTDADTLAFTAVADEIGHIEAFLGLKCRHYALFKKLRSLVDLITLRMDYGKTCEHDNPS